LGVLFLRLGHEKFGLGWLKSALQHDPRYAPVHQALADYYARRGDAENEARHRQAAAGAPTTLS
jgi:Tfp pilus assembly protein PilF